MTIEAIYQINEIINLLESQLPANVNDPRNIKLERRLQRGLAEYFKALADAFPYNKLDRIYNLYVKESVGDESGDLLDPFLRFFAADLSYRFNSHLVAIYLQGSAQMITWGKTKGGIPIAYEGPPVQQAIEWAEKHCAKLITQMAEETKTQLAKVVSDGIANKRGVPGLARDIRKNFEGMSRYRSQLIARTETANALGQSFLDRGKEMGVEGKEWVTAGGDACEICLANAAIGVIPFNSTFPSGDTTVPAHPSCRCACAPARLT